MELERHKLGDVVWKAIEMEEQVQCDEQKATRPILTSVVFAAVVVLATTCCAYGIGIGKSYGGLIAPMVPGVFTLVFHALIQRKSLKVLFVAADQNATHSRKLAFLAGGILLTVVWLILYQGLWTNTGSTVLIMLLMLLGALILYYCLRFVSRPSGWDVYVLLLVPSVVLFLVMPLAAPDTSFHFVALPITIGFVMNLLASLASEELCFRGYFVGVLGKYGRFSWYWSAAAFSLYHVPIYLAQGGPPSKIWAILVANGTTGLLLAILHSRTRNLAYVGLAHGLANALRAGFR
jgi:membrane protease YdiL (CAAX protease family)